MNAVGELWLMVAAELAMFSLFWTATARLQKSGRFQGFYYLAGFNFILAISLVMVSMRGIWPDLLTRTTTSSLELLAVAFMWHGGALLVEVATRREPFVICVIATLLTFANQIFNAGNDAVREGILFLAIAWMVLRAGWCAWESLCERDQHYRRAAAILLSVSILVATIMAARGLLGLWSNDALLLSNASVSTYITSLLVMLVLAIVNGMLAYTVVRTLIQELEHLAHHDPLTGLLNRRAFRNSHDQQWRAWLRDGHTHAVVCFDIDHFKSVNDTFVDILPALTGRDSYR